MLTPRVRVEYWKTRIAWALAGPKNRAPRGPRLLVAARSEPGCSPDGPGSSDVCAGCHSCETPARIEDDLLGGVVRRTHAGLRAVTQDDGSTTKVWLPSFVALGLADAASVWRGASKFVHGLNLLGAAGGVGLIAASASDLRKSKTVEQKLDAGGDLAWGTQGLLYLSSSSRVGKVAASIGVVGATVQLAAGVVRIKRGIARQDGKMIKLGALDLAGGLLWLGWDLIGWEQPLFVASYVVLMVGREAYANKEALAEYGGKVKGRTRQAYVETCRVVEQDLNQVLTAIRRRSGSVAGALAPG